ncbi:MAG: hypothetical protein H6773_02465 [Pseudomonadales bacterium]|nr:hypothetical protein [Candidatus Woesebacteria bacterium]MCB9801018.1 hypothetical protein [Pseudomonadales bacterium]
MTKEVVIDCEQPIDGFGGLVIILSYVLNSIPVNELSAEQQKQIVFNLPDDLSDSEIRAIIEPCIGNFVLQVVINTL